MTYITGVTQPSTTTAAAEKGPVVSTSEAPLRVAEIPPEQSASAATVSTSATDEAQKPATEESTPLALTRGRRARQHADPETASIAASTDSR